MKRLVALVAMTLMLSGQVASAAPTAPATSSLQGIGRLLFADLVTDNLTAAGHLFFPESAYVTMKTGRIANPASDYTYRLWAFFRLDLAVYHSLLASGPVRYLRTDVLANAAAWIAPGVCENGVGYWHEPAIRIVYEQRGVVKSFAVNSLISWAGHYYVIHLGPNPRPQNVGTVDAPLIGPGVPGPAGGC